MIVDPRATTVSSILRHVRRGRILDVFSIADGRAEVMEGEVLETSPMVGKDIEEFDQMEGIIIGAVIQNDRVVYPQRGVTIKTGDRIVLLSEKGSLKDVEHMFRVSMDYF